MEAIAIAIKKPNIPPVIRGARGLIETLCEEEAKIEQRQVKQRYNYATLPINDIASIVNKYGDNNTYKDVYKFIKAWF